MTGDDPSGHQEDIQSRHDDCSGLSKAGYHLDHEPGEEALVFDFVGLFLGGRRGWGSDREDGAEGVDYDTSGFS